MIAIYIKDGEPIGSESLRLMVDMKISSATIRNYFKVLSSEGFLMQPHISSGRIPTNSTLKSYWRKNLNIINALQINNLSRIKQASDRYGIFCNLSFAKSNKMRLLEVLNVQNRFSILVFEQIEVVLPYMTNLHNFATELIDMDIEEIKHIAKSVCANVLFERLENLNYAKVYNFGFRYLDFINDMALILKILKGEIYYQLKNGIYFELFSDGYLGLIQDISHTNTDGIRKDGKMFLAGKLKCDYKAFYNAIAS